MVAPPPPPTTTPCATTALTAVTGGMWTPVPQGQTAYPSGSAVTLTCLPGYTQTPAGTPITVLCTNGAFSQATGTCMVQQTPPPPPPTTTPCATTALTAVTGGTWTPVPQGQTAYPSGSAVTLTCL